MQFEFSTKTFRTLLDNNLNKLLIPRFQRDYAWEEEHISEFIEDLVKNLKDENSEYFFGTVLITGNMNGTKGELEVIDGQQRITTATILLSTIGKIFKEKSQKNLAERVWEFIIKTDDNDQKMTVLHNETFGDFFKENVQDFDKSIVDILNLEAPDEETKRILSAIKFFYNYLDENNIRNKIHSNLKNEDYISILKKIRDSLLGSKVVCVSTESKESANLIFEILNSKGKKLESIDLIKNEIFKHLTKTQPKDYALSLWKEIKMELMKREKVEMFEFYKLFWQIKYPKKHSGNDFYEEFIENIKPENFDSFLKEMKEYAIVYQQILVPNFEDDFQNRQEKFIIYYSLKNIKELNIGGTSVYVFLLRLYVAYQKGKIAKKNMERILLCLTRFYFIFQISLLNYITRDVYRREGISLYIREINEVEEIDNNIINDIIKKIKEKIRGFDFISTSFSDNINRLKFSKNDDFNQNMLSKYFIKEIEFILSKDENVFRSSSIEHIMPENSSQSKQVLNIGNLVTLETILNGQCANKSYEEKKQYYQQSRFKTVKDLLEKYPSFSDDDIDKRAREMAEIFYNSFFEL